MTLAPWPLRVLTMWGTLGKQKDCIRMLEDALKFYSKGPDPEVATQALTKLGDIRRGAK